MSWRFRPIDEIDIETRRYCALIILGISLPFLLSPFLSHLFYSPQQSFAYRFIFSRFVIWAELGMMLLYAARAEVQRFFLWAEESYNISFYIKSILGLYVLVFFAGIIAHLSYHLGWEGKNAMLSKMDAVVREYPIVLVFTSFTAGVTEEFIFRGYILSRLSLFFTNRHIPVIISALLFTYVHLGYDSISELIFSFLFGLIFGYHYQKYRNIRVLMVVHFLVDVIAMLPALTRK